MQNNILDKIKRGNSELPNRVLLAGPEKIGKSTFASRAPNPIFICSEDGLTGLENVQRYAPSSLDDLHQLLDALIVDLKGFKTVVIDTTDWLERLICKSVCERDKKNDIEDYGYGKGYVVLENELVRILQKLDVIRHKGAGIILLAHVHIRTFNSPEGVSWDRYEMKGHKKFTGILREWPDACLFAVFQVFKKKEGGGKETAIGGERVINTTWSPAHDAGNRLNLPETIALDYNTFEAEVKANSITSLRATAKELYAKATFSPEDKPKWAKWHAGIDSQTADKLKLAIEKLTSLTQ